MASNALRLAGPLAAALALAGCGGSMPTAPTSAKVVDVTSVIDLVRDELAIYLATQPAQPAVEGACYKKVQDQFMNLRPVKVTVTLKAVAARECEPPRV